MTGERGDDTSRPANDEPRAVCREERGRLLLTNPAFSLALSTTNGNILSLRHSQTDTEFIDSDEAAADGFLWRLEIAAEGTGPVALTNRDCAEFTYSTGYHRHHGNLRLWLQWSGFRAGAADIEGRVIAHLTFSPHKPTVLFEAEIQIPSHLDARSLAFPCVSALRGPDLLAEDSLFLPISGGALLSNPSSALRRHAGARWETVYPGPASLQLFGYCCGQTATLWLAPGDTAGAVKTMAASGMPRSDRLALTTTHHPTRRADGTLSLGYPCALGVVFGDWFEAAREYREWASEQPWCSQGRGGQRRVPAVTSSYGLWTSHWGGPSRTAGAARDLQRLMNVPIKLDWRCWHSCARDGHYPDYFPPRDGDDAFGRARQQLAEAGILAQFGINGLAASPQSEAWKSDHADRYVLLQSPDDDAPPLPAQSDLAPMCPSTPYWREKLASLARLAVESGADGLHIEALTASPPMLCRSAHHDHDPPVPTQWAAGLR